MNGTAVGSWADAAQTGASFDNFSVGTCDAPTVQATTDLSRITALLRFSVDGVEWGC